MPSNFNICSLGRFAFCCFFHLLLQYFLFELKVQCHLYCQSFFLMFLLLLLSVLSVLLSVLVFALPFLLLPFVFWQNPLYHPLNHCRLSVDLTVCCSIDLYLRLINISLPYLVVVSVWCFPYISLRECWWDLSFQVFTSNCCFSFSRSATLGVMLLNQFHTFVKVRALWNSSLQSSSWFQ